jgi:hypothetical protein
MPRQTSSERANRKVRVLPASLRPNSKPGGICARVLKANFRADIASANPYNNLPNRGSSSFSLTACRSAPIIGILPGCCALAPMASASGALPGRREKSRRLIIAPPIRDHRLWGCKVQDVAFGSSSTELGRPRQVRFTPDRHRTADIAGGPVRANGSVGAFSLFLLYRQSTYQLSRLRIRLLLPTAHSIDCLAERPEKRQHFTSVQLPSGPPRFKGYPS